MRLSRDALPLGKLGKVLGTIGLEGAKGAAGFAGGVTAGHLYHANRRELRKAERELERRSRPPVQRASKELQAVLRSRDEEKPRLRGGLGAILAGAAGGTAAGHGLGHASAARALARQQQRTVANFDPMAYVAERRARAGRGHRPMPPSLNERLAAGARQARTGRGVGTFSQARRVGRLRGGVYGLGLGLAAAGAMALHQRFRKGEPKAPGITMKGGHRSGRVRTTHDAPTTWSPTPPPMRTMARRLVEENFPEDWQGRDVMRRARRNVRKAGSAGREWRTEPLTPRARPDTPDIWGRESPHHPAERRARAEFARTGMQPGRHPPALRPRARSFMARNARTLGGAGLLAALGIGAAVAVNRRRKQDGPFDQDPRFSGKPAAGRNPRIRAASRITPGRIGKALGRGLRRVGEVTTRTGPLVGVNLPLPMGSKFPIRARLSPAAGLGVAAGYGAYRLGKRVIGKREGSGLWETEPSVRSGASTGSTQDGPFGRRPPSQAGGMKRGRLTRAHRVRTAKGTALRGLGSFGALAIPAAMLYSSFRNRGRREPIPQKPLIPPSLMPGQERPQQVTLDPETLARLRNLHGYPGSPELRQHGQSLGGMF